jgi:hypothetical protein
MDLSCDVVLDPIMNFTVNIFRTLIELNENAKKKIRGKKAFIGVKEGC